ncbi:MAG: barstar family protein [Clostridia bacterium]|nr:barstar family protein [Clostridia bacterium]
MNNKSQDYYKYKGITENPIILDFADCKYLGEIHKVLKVKFGLPEYYGENPNALWDLLEGLFDDMGEITAEIRSFNNLEKTLKAATAELLQVLDDVAEETPNFSYKIVS